MSFTHYDNLYYSLDSYARIDYSSWDSPVTSGPCPVPNAAFNGVDEVGNAVQVGYGITKTSRDP